MKSIEILENSSGSTEKGCDPKIVLLSWFFLDQSMHNSFLMIGLQNIETL